MSDRAELQSILTRASMIEAARQAAIARRDDYAAADAVVELSRLWARYTDLLAESEDAFAVVRRAPA